MTDLLLLLLFGIGLTVLVSELDLNRSSHDREDER